MENDQSHTPSVQTSNEETNPDVTMVTAFSKYQHKAYNLLDRLNAEAYSAIRLNLRKYLDYLHDSTPENSRFAFYNWKNGPNISFLSKFESNMIFQLITDFLQNPGVNTRTPIVLMGKSGIDPYQINLCPMRSDVENLKKLVKFEDWSQENKDKFYSNWREIIQSWKSDVPFFSYTNLSKQGSPTRKLVLLKFLENDEFRERVERLNRFPCASEKDLELTKEYIVDDNQRELIFGQDPFTEKRKAIYQKLRHTGSTIEIENQHCNMAFVWLHKTGWRLFNGHQQILLEKNYQKCLVGTGLLEICYPTGKGIKKIRFSQNEHVKKQIRNITASTDQIGKYFKQGVLYFSQGSSEWSINDHSKNWRPVMRVDLNSEEFIHLQYPYKIYSKFPFVDTYQIDKVLTEHEYPDLSTEDKRLGDMIKKNLYQELKDLQTSLGDDNHRHLDSIVSLFENDNSYSLMQLMTIVKREILICPITQGTLIDPVITKYGHSFNKNSLTKWVRRTFKCPMTRQRLEFSECGEKDTVTLAILDILERM